MIVFQKYKTRLKPADIDNWILTKKDEKIGLIKIKRYSASSNESGFFIRERRFNKYQSFMPRIIGKYDYALNGTGIDLKIIPSYTGILFFAIFIIVCPWIILSSNHVNINGIETSDLIDRFKLIGILLIIIVPLMCFLLIRPVYKFRRWIENELNLEKIE